MMPKEVSWKKRLPDGTRREVRAVRHGGRWRLQCRIEPGTAWTYHETIPVEDLEHLRVLIENRYRRRRATWEEVGEVERLLEAARREAGAAV